MYDTMGAREGGIRGKQNPRPIPRQNRRRGNTRLNAPAAQICVFNAVSGQIHNKPRKIHFRGFYAFVGYILIFSDKL